MIIQCRKCGSKFRFDENMVTDDGIWVRCSLCQNIFFQDNPAGENVPSRLDARRPDGIPIVKADQEIDRSPAGEPVKEVEGDAEDTPSLFAAKKFDDLEGLSEQQGGNGPEERTEAFKEDKSDGKGSVGRFFAWFFFLFLVLLLGGTACLWIFPQLRQQVSPYLSPYGPVLEKIWAGKVIGHESVLDLVKIQDVRQHFVNNTLMGEIRVIEGTAVNASGRPLTRIQLRGKLYNAENKVLSQQVSFAGNLLTDAELATLTEEDMQMRLASPQGSVVSNDRVSPEGLIPFMIVFVNNPPGVAKATVMTAKAEKLLE